MRDQASPGIADSLPCVPVLRLWQESGNKWHQLGMPLPVVSSIGLYYRDPAVRAAMLRYCGAADDLSPTAVFVAGLRRDAGVTPTWDQARRLPASSLAELWEGGYDIARSLWDRQHLVFLLELDYQNIDAPGEPFVHPADVFLKLEPAYRAARRALARLNLHPQVVMTGRGYQLSGVIPLADPLIARLADLLPGVPSWLSGVEHRRPEGVTDTLDPTQARAAAGLGLLIEHAAHLVMREAQESTVIPVVMNGTVVGAGLVGREAVSLDFSHVGDPLDVRHLRCAFSTYQFHRMRPDIVGAAISEGVPPLVALPRRHRPLMSMLTTGRTLDAALKDSRRSIDLPNVAAGVAELLRHYQASPLAAFHGDFYGDEPTVPDVRLAGAPACVGRTLEWPNDRLLKPEHIQHLVRVLMSRGWKPSAIAALVRSKYEQDYAWGDRWLRLDPRTRAEFDVRVFAGMIATGLDSLVDFNCVSAQEKDMCPRTECRFDLRIDRDRLKRRLGA